MLTQADLQAMITDTESEILSVVDAADGPATRELYDMVRYHMGLDGSSGVSGKRLRPLLGLLAYASIAGDHVGALPGAAAVELGHNFSLVHDDIEDRDVERRHRAALWTVFGVGQAINTGDTLFVLSRLALHRLSNLGFSDSKVLRLFRLYDRTCLALCEGQFLDLWGSEHGDRMTVDRYFDMIGRKTAALIAASIESGAMLATDDQAVVDAYRRFGWALGLAFQLNDDLLGIWGAEQETGKEPSDLAKRKRTLPVLYALEHASPDDRDRLRAIYDREEPTPDDPTPDEVAEARAILDRTGAGEYTRREARRLRDEALEALDAAGVIEGAARDRLRDIIVGAIRA